MKKAKWIISSALALSLFSSGVYAGTVLQTYKTVRGDFATVEKEEVHKNRIALKVDGVKSNKPTWYANDTTYVPLRDAAELLGVNVNYNSATMTAELTKKGTTTPTTPTTPTNPGETVISSTDLPYIYKSKNGMGLKINSYKATSSGVQFNVTITNHSSTQDKGMLMTSTWELYDGKNTLEFSDQSRQFWDNDYLRAGQSLTGDLYFEGLTNNETSFYLYAGLWQYINKEEVKLKFKVE